MKINAIETRHNGYRFRSRLEARWAVFFEAIKEPYLYESEGFKLRSVISKGEHLEPWETWYLPDFFLPRKKMWVEIKPIQPTRDEKIRCEILCLNSRQDVVMLIGDPWLTNEYIFDKWNWVPAFMSPKQTAEIQLEFTEFPPTYDAEGIALSFCQGFPCRFGLGDSGIEVVSFYQSSKKELEKVQHPKILNAYTAARSARF